MNCFAHSVRPIGAVSRRFLSSTSIRASAAESLSTSENGASKPARLLTWNVASLRSLLRKQPDALQALVDDFAVDAICLQETKLQEFHVPEFTDILDNYQSFWYCSTARKGYSGTAIFLRNNLSVEDVRYGIGDESADAEGRVITIKLPKSYLVTCYTPNAGTGLKRLDYRTQTFEGKMTEYLRNLASERPLLYCGDLNVAHEPIDLENPKGNSRSAGFTDEERSCFRELIKDGELLDTFRMLYPAKRRKYTYWNYRTRARERNAGWRIDYFLVSKEVKPAVGDCVHLDGVLGSDHCPVLLELNDQELIN
ncbi:hypothetical protein NDN08_002871 [Rhodosorus marinus]|uniref:Endonuclease/exonuclease/phosphatase domain-containing protein n=1 Tax=Rhodosorus marinus TaxID=101924 RepID=A0AAV8UUZ2_9RHOD|nr:hypothetical protein NDN08_002871 [Rhodosorus marinus]